VSESEPFHVFDQVRHALADVLVGHDALIDRLLAATLSGGHVLIEGPPGLAKTRAVNLFAQLVSADFARIQATPDLLPADLTGTNIFEQGTGSFRFHEGPLFNNIILVDEINRAPPKVQSALLEAMAERQISAGGVTRQLDAPFLVVATQNPIEHEGTYPLPEAQLDRFMFFINVELPELALELKILDLVLAESARMSPDDKLQPLLSRELIVSARQSVSGIFVSEPVRDYIARLVTTTRGHGAAGELASDIEHPASPRASIFLAQAAQAYAWLGGRDHVVPEDVRTLAPDVISGRLVLRYEAQARGQTNRHVIDNIVDAVPIL